MKEPKLILNLSFENEEVEKKIEIAMDKYIQEVCHERIDKIITKNVDRRINDLVGDSYWKKRLNGQYIDDYIAAKVEVKIKEVIDKQINKILQVKLASLLVKE